MTKIKQPKIRFKGHINDWEQRKLKDVSKIYDGTHQTPKYTDSGVMFLSVENIRTLKSNKYISQESFDKEFKIRPKKGDILMTRIGDIGTPNVVESDEETAYYVSLALIKSKMHSYFMKANILATPFQNELWKRTLHIAFPKKINKNEIGETIFNFPDYVEQEKIGEFFKTLDDTIALHQQKLEVTKQFKQTMLKKMFPKNGETTPEIRFKGFTEDWEKCKLKDLCSLSTGKLDANAMTSDGKYSFFTSGEKVYKTDTFAFDGDAILIAGNGNVGLQHIYRGKFNAYQRTYVLMDFKINKEILSNQITLELPKVLRRETRVGVIPYIVKDMLTELPISYPRNVKEQTLISEYFNTLNSNIFNIECRLVNLLNLKQTMLKKLYI